jgi:N-acetylneuraminic acid mutarotase
LLIVGCGIDPSPTAPEDPGLTSPEPVLPLPEPEFVVATTNVWTTKAAMPTLQTFLGAGVVNGVLYAVGGNDSDGEKLTTVQAYTPGSNSWATKAPLPSARGSLSGVGTINSVLYVAGGVNSSTQVTKTLFAYTPSTNTWTTKAPMPVAGAVGASGVIGGKLYVYSGYTYTLGSHFSATIR